VHGNQAYGKGRHYHTLFHFINMRVGNCAHFAVLVHELLLIQGISAIHYNIQLKYSTTLGEFATGHNLVLAGGLLIDAEVNVAFNIGSLSQLTAMTPFGRLSRLLSADKVYGFYDWMNYPPIRIADLGNGYDGGILSWVYQFILAGIGQGATSLRKIPFR